MRYVTSPALLLDVFDLHDKDRIVTFLTPEHGKKRGVAQGARRKYSRFSGQLQPLAKAKITWFEKEGRDLGRISDVELLRPALGLSESLEGLLLGSYLAEHMTTFAQENEASELFFRLLDSSVEALLRGIDPALVARYYEVWVLRLAGVFPAPWECPLCGRAFEEGEEARLAGDGDALLCASCAGTDPSVRPVSGEVMEMLRRSTRESLPKMAESPPAPETLAGVEHLAGRIRRSFLGRELKSYEVMQQALAEP